MSLLDLIQVVFSVMKILKRIGVGMTGFDVGVMNEAETRSSDKNMKGYDSAEMKKNVTPADTSYLEKTLQQCVQDKTLQNNLSPTKYDEKLNTSQGSLVSIAMRPPKLVQDSGTREARLEAEVQHEKFDTSSSSTKSFSARSSNCTTNKENDCFVTARKNSSTRANDENSWKRPEKILLQCSTNPGTVPLACEKRAVTKRKALTEATNLQQSNDLEITGKWQCPQKRKPYVGPALKQLRLERWVRRV
uniref:Uncharacterized protein n=1 Tax=Lotus japonicus TaxID=34305 RepID=I3SF21_LOTJA|nr:unknown [Lotus japonicus]